MNQTFSLTPSVSSGLTFRIWPGSSMSHQLTGNWWLATAGREIALSLQEIYDTSWLTQRLILFLVLYPDVQSSLVPIYSMSPGLLAWFALPSFLNHSRIADFWTSVVRILTVHSGLFLFRWSWLLILLLWLVSAYRPD